MANYNASLKSIRQTKKRTLRNRARRSAVRTTLKLVRDGLHNKAPQEELEARFRKFSKELDKAAQRNILHKNKAARLKSRLTKQISALSK